MIKRVTAWVLLIGFVLLIANLLVFKVNWEASLLVYVVIVFFYILAFKK